MRYAILIVVVFVVLTASVFISSRAECARCPSYACYGSCSGDCVCLIPGGWVSGRCVSLIMMPDGYDDE